MMHGVSETTSASHSQSAHRLARSITWAASKQTYLIVRFLVDRDKVNDAYRAYAYFRWVDDRLDEGGLSASERMAFIARQAELVERCYRGDWPEHLREEEHLLADLVRSDREPDSGLQSYIRQMMAVMAFDARRRGRLISEAELADYTRWLAGGVTEALHYFIGHASMKMTPPPAPPLARGGGAERQSRPAGRGNFTRHGCGYAASSTSQSPQNARRYLAATGAHIAHMLRDMLEDIEAGYINLPREVIESGGVGSVDVQSAVCRNWVRERVALARECFRAGRAYLAEVENARCRLAGYTYIARFESVLDALERDDYRFRPAYLESRTLNARLKMGRALVSQAINRRSLSHPISPAQR